MSYYILYILGRLRRLYFMQVPENKDEYLLSRRFFTLDGMMAIAILSLCGGPFLAGFIKHMGIDDTYNGIIGAIPVVVNLVQPFGAVYAERLKQRKLLVCSLALIHRLLFASMFFLPLLSNNLTVKTILLVIPFSLAFLLGQFIAPAASNWIVSLTPQRIRGRYFGTREAFMIGANGVIILVAGKLLDVFKADGRQDVGFMLVGGIVFILALINFYALSNVKEPEQEQVKSQIDIVKLFTVPFADKGFRNIIVLSVLWNISFQMVAPYFGVYLVGDLKLDYMFLMLIGAGASVLRVLLTKPWGKLADKTSWAFVTKLAFILLGIMHIAHFFLYSGNWTWYYPIIGVLSAVPWAVLGMAMFNIQFDFAPSEGRAVFLGANAAISGVIGFLGVLLGAIIMNLMKNSNLMFFNIPIRPQQLLMLISGVAIILCAVYTHFVVEKGIVLRNNKDGKLEA